MRGTIGLGLGMHKAYEHDHTIANVQVRCLTFGNTALLIHVMLNLCHTPTVCEHGIVQYLGQTSPSHDRRDANPSSPASALRRSKRAQSVDSVTEDPAAETTDDDGQSDDTA